MTPVRPLPDSPLHDRGLGVYLALPGHRSATRRKEVDPGWAVVASERGGESVDDEDCRMVLASGRTSGITSGTDAEALRHADLNAADRLKCDLPDGLRG